MKDLVSESGALWSRCIQVFLEATEMYTDPRREEGRERCWAEDGTVSPVGMSDSLATFP